MASLAMGQVRSKWQVFRQQALLALMFALLALAVMCGIMLLLYNRSLHMMNERFDAQYGLTVQSQMEMFEQRLYEMEQVAQQISSDPYLSAVRLQTPGYDVYSACQLLKRYTTANHFITEVALFMPSQATVISSNGTYPVSVFMEKYQAEALRGLLESFPDRKADHQALIETRANATAAYVYVNYLPHMGIPKTRMVLFMLEKAHIDALFQSSITTTDGSLLIYDKTTGKCLYRYRTQGAAPAFDAFERFETPQGKPLVVQGKGNAGRYAMVDSRIMPWRYVFAADEQIAGRQIRSMRNFLLAILLLATVLMLLLACVLAVAHGRPWHRVLRSLGLDSPQTDAATAIMQHVGGIVQRNNLLAEQLTDHATQARNYLIQQLLCGYQDRGGFQAALAKAGIAFPFPLFTVYCLRVQLEQAIDSQRRIALQMDLQYLAEQTAAACGAAYCVEWPDGQIVLLLNHNAQRDGALAEELCEAFIHMAGIAPTVGIGETCAKMAAVHMSLMQAMTACECGRFKGLPMQYYAQMVADQPAHSANQQEQIGLLIQAIKHGDAKGARERIEQMLSELCSDETPLVFVQQQCIDMLSVLIRAIDDIPPDTFSARIGRLFSFQSVDEYTSQLSEFCAELCDMVRARMDEGKESLLRRVRAHIEKHYADGNLSVQQIAEALDVSPSYLTRYCRETGDTTPLKMIERRRIDRACELLRTTDLRIADIVQQVGYIDHTSFIRRFRLYEGITPSQYRVIYKRE